MKNSKNNFFIFIISFLSTVLVANAVLAWTGKVNGVVNPAKIMSVASGGVYTVMGVGTSSTAPTGMVAYYKLDETSGTLAADETGNHDGTTTDATVNQTGKIGQAYSFDGSGDYISIDDHSDFDFGTGPFAMGFWLYKEGEARGDLICWKNADGTDDFGFLAQSDETIDWWLAIDGPGSTIVSNGSVFTMNNWHHFILTRENDGTVTTYLDGIADGSGSSTADLDSIDNGTPIWIGSNKSGATPSYGFNGLIDEVGIWNTVLSAADVASLYNFNNGKAYPLNDPAISSASITSTSGNDYQTDDLTVSISSSDAGSNITDWRESATSLAVVNMPFDLYEESTTADAVKDYSTYSYDGQLGGGNSSYVPTWTTDCQVGGCYDFDGTDDYISLGDVFDVGTSDFTISAWINTSDAANGARVIAKSVWGTSDYDGYFLFLYDGYVCGVLGDGTSAVYLWGSTTTVNDGSWHQIVLAFDRSGNMTSYVDGAVKDSEDISSLSASNINTTQNLYIGLDNGETAYSGMIDEVMIFDTLLTAEQIAQLYTDGSNNLHMETLVAEETAVDDEYTVAVTATDGETEDSTTTSSVTILAAVCASNGESCTYGDDCCESLCVDNTCRSSCSSYGGVACSDDGSNAYGSDGACETDTPSCDEDEVAYDGSSTYYADCSDAYSSGSTVYECDSDATGGYTTDGMCVSGGSCDVDSVCYDGSAYQGALGSCSDDDSCDSDVSNGAYTRDGYVCSSSCVTDGSVADSGSCCTNANCASGTCSSGTCSTLGTDYLLLADYGADVYAVDASNIGTAATTKVYNGSNLTQCGMILGSVGDYGACASRDGHVVTINSSGTVESTYTGPTNYYFARQGVGFQGDVNGFYVTAWESDNKIYKVDGINGTATTINGATGGTGYNAHVADLNNLDNILSVGWSNGTSYLKRTTNAGGSWSTVETLPNQQNITGWYSSLFVGGRASEYDHYYSTNGGSTITKVPSGGGLYFGSEQPLDQSQLLVYSLRTDNKYYLFTSSGLGTEKTVGASMPSSVTYKKGFYNVYDADNFGFASIESGTLYLYITNDNGSSWTKSTGQSISSSTLDVDMTTSGNYVGVSDFNGSTSFYIYDISGNSWSTFTADANARYTGAL